VVRAGTTTRVYANFNLVGQAPRARAVSEISTITRRDVVYFRRWFQNTNSKVSAQVGSAHRDEGGKKAQEDPFQRHGLKRDKLRCTLRGEGAMNKIKVSSAGAM
jgi:hypothetical protein